MKPVTKREKYTIAGALAAFLIVGFASQSINNQSKEVAQTPQPVKPKPTVQEQVQRPAYDAKYQDRVDNPMDYVIQYWPTRKIEKFQVYTERSMLADESLWESCRAEDVDVPGDLKVWHTDIEQCLHVPEFRAVEPNQRAEHYRDLLKKERESDMPNP